MTQLVPTAHLRARFAAALAEMYGLEVPAYQTLVEVSREVNRDVLTAQGAHAERLGSIARVTAERHGAIRVGSPRELSEVCRVFAAFGMYPVGFYDLRDASSSTVPVVATAFRPTDPDQLAANPFRVFTSMLTCDDRRFFDDSTQQRLETFISQRELFPAELLQLADAAAERAGLVPADAEQLLQLAAAAFKLSPVPVERQWYEHLEAISAVAADIGGVASTHINHLTPRVLDIDELYRRMQARGIAMIEEIQGPPRGEGPEVLLRQTSFKALGESRTFRNPDGSLQSGVLRVRFGEVEQRGLALTPRGRDLHDHLLAQVDALCEPTGNRPGRAEVARRVWADGLPASEAELAAQGLAYFTFTPSGSAPAVAGVEGGPGQVHSVVDLVRSGALSLRPIVYEDFLPRSAAGIFQSNLDGDGARDDAHSGTPWDVHRLSEVIGVAIADPYQLYARQQRASLQAAERALDVRLDLEAFEAAQRSHQDSA